MSHAPIIHVVDDDDAVRNAIQSLLVIQGFATKGYSCAADFLEQYDPRHCGVLITDLAMPGMTGEQLQRRLIEACSSLAVVVVTGAVDEKTTVDVLEGGAVTLLEKPFSSAALIQSVRRGLEQSQQLHQKRAG